MFIRHRGEFGGAGGASGGGGVAHAGTYSLPMPVGKTQ